MADAEKYLVDDRIAPGVAPASLRRRNPMPLGQRALLGLLALACVVLIGVSGANLAGSLSVAGAEKTSAAIEDASGAKNGFVAKSTPSGVKEASVKTPSQGGPAVAEDASGSAGSSTASVSKPSGSSGATGAQGSSGSKPSSGAPSYGAAGGSQQAPVPNTVTVSVSVSSLAVGGPVSASSTLVFEKGATAYDALCGLGLSVNASNTAYGVYVSAIGGLAEKEHGGSSGWKYSVNGAYPGKSSSAYVLSDGDVVVWQYVLSA